METALNILRKPRMTEKAATLSDDNRVVVFEVPVSAEKPEIRTAVEEAFSVEVEQVRTMVVRGKVKRRGRHLGKRSNWKKAIVTLKEGSMIDFYGNL